MQRLSRAISYYLRHAPQELGLQLEPGGWVEVAGLLAGLQAKGHPCTLADLTRLVASSDKRRFALDGQRIRANQGHSVPVNLQLTPQSPPPLLYHGTTARFVPGILEQGLHRGKRHHVHLSQCLDSARQVGQRRGSVVILQVDAESMQQQGHPFYCSANQVWLTNFVPPQFIRLTGGQPDPG
ncbi:RNA 2'-phosphotransferase [bacterium]|nr:RNA 2'-phosphotransferase [bacterium]